MGRVHFFTVSGDTPFDTSECAEISKQLEKVLSDKGFPDDRCVVMYAVEYKGSVTDNG